MQDQLVNKYYENIQLISKVFNDENDSDDSLSSYSDIGEPLNQEEEKMVKDDEEVLLWKDIANKYEEEREILAKKVEDVEGELTYFKTCQNNMIKDEEQRFLRFKELMDRINISACKPSEINEFIAIAKQLQIYPKNHPQLIQLETTKGENIRELMNQCKNKELFKI